MKSTRDTVALGRNNFIEKFLQGVKENQKAVNNLAFFTFGIMASHAVLFDGLAPFGVAFLAAANSTYMLAAFAGCLIGYFLPSTAAGTLKYIIALAVVLSIRWFVGNHRRMVDNPLFAPSACFGAMLVTGLVTLIFGGLNIYDLVMLFAQSVLGAGAAFFLKRALVILKRETGIAGLGGADLACMVITCGLLVISLSQVTVGGYSVGRAAVILLILLAARYGKESAGAIVGITAGACISLSGTPYAYLAGAYGFGGLLAGVFSIFGRFGCACAFILVNAVAALVSGASQHVIISLYEIMTATVLFMLLPARAGRQLSYLFNSQIALAKGDETAKDSVAMKLDFSAKALSEVSRTVDMVSQKLEKRNVGDVSTIFGQTADEVCRRCGLKLFCWDTSFHETMSAFNSMTGVLRKNQKITVDDVPGYFAEKCCKINTVVGAVNKYYTHFCASEGASRRIREIRGVALEQFDGMAQLLRDLSDEIKEVSKYDFKTANLLKQSFEANLIPYKNVGVSIDKFDRMSVEILFPTQAKYNTLSLLHRLSDICERTFDEPSATRISDAEKLVFSERASYAVEFGAAQINHEGMDICGDSYDYFLDGKGRAHMIISDGMGSGGEAAVDSAVTTGLITQLLKAGFDFSSAIKIVNCALIVKSNEETLSTIDIGCIDLYTGRAEFLKAGAAPTFIKKGDKVGRIETASMPVGILGGVDFKRTTIKLAKGDIVVMVSDGVVASGVDWVLSEIELFAHKCSANDLARRIAGEAKRRRADGHDDDITVVVAILLKGV